ncbi:mitochondrial sodium/calcium exchanger protein-like [Ctenocephalides felis]|uniref:mitochondrial sodium/calcium exchanger protein-like n=1 Tax=Ctenocephalides felis TaxID=7515 RepID=UPI000E6E44B7|nr:mitochondrial sodium/calcium exchanger protein-like [Ctenocephalides felis]
MSDKIRAIMSNYSLSLINETFAKYGVRIQKHENYVSSVDETNCANILSVDPEDRCQFVKSTASCTDAIQIINYMEVFFCDLQEHESWKIFGLSLSMILFGVYIFVILAITSEYIFCPALAVMAKILHLSESVAGVTILAFGNAAADILGTLMDVEEETPMIYTEMLGTGLFICCMVSGCICLIKPFVVKPQDIIRDVLFYMFSVIWIFGIIIDECVEIWEALSLLGIYVIYIIVVLIMHTHHTRKKGFLEAATITFTMPLKTMTKSISVAPLKAFRFQQTIMARFADQPQTQESASTSDINMFKDFLNYMKPLSKDEWVALSTPYKIIGIFKIPVILFLRLVMPVVDYDCPRNGWCKLLNSIQFVITPIYVVVILRFADKDLFHMAGFSMKLWYVIFVIGCIPMIAMLIKTRVNTQPKYHDLMSFVSFLSTTSTIHFLSEEVVSIVTTLGKVLRLSNDILGLTALAWGNGIGDLVSNIAIARQGLQKMAFAACYGGPMLTTVLAMSIGFIIRALNSPYHKAAVRPGALGRNCVVFLCCTLTSTAFMISLTRFHARASHGIFLMILYATFLMFCILAEMSLIHPYGTDHNPEPEESIQDVLLDIA